MLAHAQQYRHPRNAKQHIHTLLLTSSHYTEVCLASQRKHAASPVVRRSTPARSRCFKISLAILGKFPASFCLERASLAGLALFCCLVLLESR